MAFIEVTIAVPATTAPSGAWVPSAITKILNVTPEGAAAGDTYYVYGSPNNTGTTASKDAELVATIVVTSAETQVTLSTLVTNRPGPAFQYYAVVLGAGSGGGGKQVVVSGIDETAPPVGGVVTADQGAPNAGGPLAWPVAASQVGPWAVAATQGTSPWVTAFSAPQPVTQSGAWTVTQGTPPWSVVFPAAQHVIVDSVTGHVTVDQGTSPWVTTVSNFPASQQVTQGTSPWVVSGTVTANQGGAPWSVTIPTQALSASVTDASQATLVQAAITGRTEGGGVYQRVSADGEGHLQVNAVRPASAVGDLRVAEPTPLTQVLFTYGINPDVVNTSVSGAASVTGASPSALATVATGAAANSKATLATRRYLVFRAGQGAQIDFTALYTAGVAGSTQWGGVGGVSNALFFGYQDTLFGILVRTAGVREIQTLTITVASTTTENATVRLEGVAKLVPVTNSGVITTTAREIAAADYSATGSGWDAYQIGNTVVFLCRSTGNKVGVFSLTATTAVGAFVETAPGALPTEAFIPQTAWNVDRCNGAGGALNPSGFNLDPTKMNFYSMSGSTNVGFFIQNSLNGELFLVHELQYVNSSTLPPLNNPSFPVTWIVENVANATNVQMQVAGGAAFTDGPVRLLGPKNAARNLKTNVTAVVPILTIRNNLTVRGYTNRAQIHMWSLTASCDGTRATQIIVTVNATLTGAVYQAVSATSVAAVDTSATASSGGTVIAIIQLGQTSDELVYPPQVIDFFLAPGETMTFTATSAAAADVAVGANWIEDQ